ncbi:carbohydrate ABC transporter permease [Brachybacterium saurashtrense]|uniref:Sugar ABC transporter permease n=1 Tax=Brachybacterium saurashtrense TaxID=556288 RepID=A0A345YS95_9MICO|nr:sugar ABC transporter permease [Brachybacterium saurashtrense]AXK46797.1 sugar ABC transporter permease [Brachybacterium saurashtrense]RRR22512.1 sugar ABC transporter permease [Brachybacterium saurashtrense]
MSSSLAADPRTAGPGGAAGGATAAADPAGPRPGRATVRRRNLRTGLLFISPWIVGVLIFIVYPVAYSIGLSFTRYSGMEAPTWVGVQNYVTAAADPLVRTAVGNTLFYAVIAVPLGLLVALTLAIAMNQNVREVALYRTIFYAPSLIPAFAMSFIFIVFLNPQFGAFNQVINLFGGPNVNLLGDPTGVKIAIILMAQLGAGNAALIFLAGLRNIPRTIYEAARVDGAGPIRQFAAITFPLLTPVLLFNLITGVSGALQVFTEAYIVTNGTGDPDAGALFYMMYLYKNAFGFAELGYASALAVLLFLAGLALALLIYWLSRRFVNYDVEAG